MIWGYSPLTAGIVAVDEAFALADRLGLGLIELSYDLVEAMPEAQRVEDVNDLVRATGIETTVHLSYVDLNLASLAPIARRAAVERTQAGLGYAADVRARCAVLHLGTAPLADPRAHALAGLALEESLSELKDSPVTLAVENLGLTTFDRPRTPVEMRDVLDRHGLSACMDVGHAHVQGRREGRDLLTEYRDTLGRRIVHLHLHDNVGDHDAHLPIGDGSIPLERWLRSETCTPATMILEIDSDEQGLASSVERFRTMIEGGTP